MFSCISGFALETDMGHVADVVFAVSDSAIRNAGFSVGIIVVAFCAGHAVVSSVAVIALSTVIWGVAISSHAVVFSDVALHYAIGVDFVPSFLAAIAPVSVVASHADWTVVWGITGARYAVSHLDVAVNEAVPVSVIVVASIAGQTVDSRVSSIADIAGRRCRTSTGAVVAVRYADIA